MSIAQKLPKIAPCSVQKCPLCKEDKILFVQGLVKMNEEGEPQLFPDRGYSFCNCKSIWFTDWENIDVSSEVTNESPEVFQYYIAKGIIRNKGYLKNKFSCLGDAPKTVAEAERLGFDVGTDAKDFHFEDFDLIWSYHVLQRECYPLTMLQAYYDLLKVKGVLFIAMPDPFFICFDDAHRWGHWLLRQNHIMWDMDSFCDEAEKIGFKTIMKLRNFEIKPKNDMHLIFEKT